MTETPKHFAERRFQELKPLIDLCAPGSRLHVEHFPVSHEECQKIVAALNPKAPPALRAKLGHEKARMAEETFRQITELKMRRIDPDRLIKLNALGVELAKHGYLVGWADLNPHDAIKLSELDLRALGLGPTELPNEGAFLAISFELHA
jgi:hypothetical protein